MSKKIRTTNTRQEKVNFLTARKVEDPTILLVSQRFFLTRRAEDVPEEYRRYRMTDLKKMTAPKQQSPTAYCSTEQHVLFLCNRNFKKLLVCVVLYFFQFISPLYHVRDEVAALRYSRRETVQEAKRQKVFFIRF